MATILLAALVGAAYVPPRAPLLAVGGHRRAHTPVCCDVKRPVGLQVGQDTPRPPPPPPPPPQLSGLLLLGDASLVGVYSLIGTLVQLLAAEDVEAYSGADIGLNLDLTMSLQDARDTIIALDDAGCLAIGWLVAAYFVGSLDMGWPELDHENSRFGCSRILRTWMWGWPLGRVLSQCAEVVVSGGAVDLFEPRADSVAEALAFASGDALGLLVVMVLYRRVLLTRWMWW